MKPARLRHPCLKRAQQADHQGSDKSSLKYNSASILQRVGFQWQVLLNDGKELSTSFTFLTAATLNMEIAQTFLWSE